MRRRKAGSKTGGLRFWYSRNSDLLKVYPRKEGHPPDNKAVRGMFYYCKKPSTNAEIMTAYADQRNQLAFQGKSGEAGKETYPAFVGDRLQPTFKLMRKPLLDFVEHRSSFPLFQPNLVGLRKIPGKHLFHFLSEFLVQNHRVHLVIA